MDANEIVRLAKSYIGKTETPNNSGFTDKKFETKMQEVGWIKTIAWCTFLCELIWTEACCDTVLRALLRKLFSGSATTTYKNFELDGTFKVGKEPRIGAIAIWRHGVSWQGHAAIVTEVIDKVTFKTVEGNTNDKGGREGYIVAPKTRKTNNPFTNTGLNLVGFIYPA